MHTHRASRDRPRRLQNVPPLNRRVCLLSVLIAAVAIRAGAVAVLCGRRLIVGAEMRRMVRLVGVAVVLVLLVIVVVVLRCDLGLGIGSDVRVQGGACKQRTITEQGEMEEGFFRSLRFGFFFFRFVCVWRVQCVCFGRVGGFGGAGGLEWVGWDLGNGKCFIVCVKCSCAFGLKREKQNVHVWVWREREREHEIMRRGMCDVRVINVCVGVLGGVMCSRYMYILPDVRV